MTDESQAKQVPLADLRKSALEHYERLASEAHEWYNVIPRAINFYYDEQEHLAASPPVAVDEPPKVSGNESFVAGYREGWLHRAALRPAASLPVASEPVVWKKELAELYQLIRLEDGEDAPLTNALIGLNVDATFASQWRRRKDALERFLAALTPPSAPLPSEPSGDVEARVSASDVEHAIRSAMDFCHNSRDWEEEGGAWGAFIAPILERLALTRPVETRGETPK